MLPTELYIHPREISELWHEMDDDDKEEAISNYLSDQSGFCHKGFSYEEADGRIHITNIIWDEEE